MLIIDGSNILHRCRYTSPQIDWKMYAFMATRSFLSSIHTFKDRDVVVCWDLNGSYRRKRVYADYKKHPPIDMTTPDGRKESAELDAYVKAREWLHENLPKMSVQSIQERGIEADDIAYWLITEKYPSVNVGLEKNNYFCTSDRDWCQFTNEYWAWYNPMKKTKDENGIMVGASEEEKTFTYKDFLETYGTRKRFIMRKALLGDSSDNIPKCYLMGEKKVDSYIDKLLQGESIWDKSAVSQHLQDFISSGQLTINLELIMFGLLCRGERRKLHNAYDASKAKVSQPNLFDWAAMGASIDSATMVEFGNYLKF